MQLRWCVDKNISTIYNGDICGMHDRELNYIVRMNVNLQFLGPLFLGYLSNSPHKFFRELIEFVSSLVEQGVPPLTVVQTYLPNLFGPVFGTKNHSVSCKLLEYGYLAACSQHQ